MRTPTNDYRFLTALFLLGTLSGCAPGEPARSPSLPQAEAPSDDESRTVDMTDDAADRPASNRQQQEAMQAILDAGGTVECGADGWPISIDLVSDRASADDQTVRSLLQFPELQKLRLAVNAVSSETLSDLTALTKLQELMLQDAPINDAQLAALLPSMPALQRLTLRRLTGVTDEGVNAIAQCRQLDVLALIEMSQISGAGLESLSQMDQLRSLDLRNCGRLRADDFEHLMAFASLSEVKLGGPAINDDVLAAVARMPALTSLTVEDAGITGAGLQELARTPGTAERLRALFLTRCFGVTDKTLDVVNRLPALETLSLRDMMITGEFLTSLDNSLQQPLGLRTLIITDAFLTNQSVQSLPNVAPRLERLDLRGNQGVTDDSLDALRRLPELKHVSLENTGISDPAAEL